MGWGLWIKDIYVSRVRKDELPEKKEECEERLDYLKEKLLVLAAAAPRDVDDGSGMKILWEEHIIKEVDYIFNEIIDNAIMLDLCREALRDLDKVEET
jgi:hypothetical protein